MNATKLQKNLCYKILQKTHPDIHSYIIEEVKKGCTSEKLQRVPEVKQLFNELGLEDRRLFIAVIFRLFHPGLYQKDNADIPLSRGLNIQLAKAMNIDPGNTVRYVNESRTWLKYNIEDLRVRTDLFFEQNFLQSK